jgi:hypothetical protein
MTSPDGVELYEPDVDVSGVDERALMRRIDWHVIPWLAVLYLLNLCGAPCGVCAGAC